MAQSSPPRSLADQLRGWPDERLARLLTARPDLAAPAPQDSAQLASRAGTRASVLHAVDQLDLLRLAVLDAAVGLGGTTSLAQLQGCLHASPAAVAEAVEDLLAVALLWGRVEELRALTAVADVVGTTLSGLGPPAATLLAAYGPDRLTDLARDLGLVPSGDKGADVRAVARHLADPGNVTALLAEVDPAARAIVDHLDRHGAEGTAEAADRRLTRSAAVRPVEQLLARGLLLSRGRTHVVLPREVGIAVRGGHTTRTPVDQPPPLATSSRDQQLVDRAAGGAAFELVRHVELMLEHWGTQPPNALRGGGLGVRELRATAELLHLDEPAAALHVEVASAAGLLAVGETDDHDAVWLPTDAFDLWSAAPVADRWVRLALAWLESPRLVGLVGSRDAANKPVNALVPDLERPWLPETRRAALDQLAALEPGQVLAAGTGVPSLVERLRWLRPRRPAQRADAVGWVVAEAATLGVTALGGLSRHGRALLGEEPRRGVPAALEPLLPEPVDHVLLQADLTAIAPGPLEPELAHNLAAMADIESRGGATVYRFTAASVRRAFDAGWSAAEIRDFVAASSRTPVPQPLGYLVDDVSRRFGTVRVGAAESFLRSDDEAALTELVHDPRAASLRLRRIAPTVVVSDTPVDILLLRLRELGSAPVVEAPDGSVRLARRDTHRARPPRTRPPSAAARRTARVSATVNAIRAGDRAAASRPTEPVTAAAGGSPSATLAVLRECVEAGSTVWISYLDNHGAAVERVVDPVKVEGGRLSAYDHRADDVRTFAVHRITAVAPARPPA